MKTTAEELRRLADATQERFKEAWGDPHQRVTLLEDLWKSMYHIATRCEGMVSLEAVEETIDEVVSEMTDGVRKDNASLHTAMGLLFAEEGKRIIARLKGGS